MTISRWCTFLLAAALVAVALPAAALAQGVESSPIGVDDMVPGAGRPHRAHKPGWLGVMLQTPKPPPDDHAHKKTADKSAKRAAKKAATKTTRHGVDVVRVLRASPAANGGLQRGDRILSVDGQAVGSPADVQNIVRRVPPGSKTHLELRRGGKLRKLAVVVGTAPDPQKVLRTQFVGHKAPRFSAHAMGDKPASISLNTFKGKPLVIDFWATWCGPCRVMTHRLAKLHAKKGDAVHFVGLTSESDDIVQRYLNTHHHGFPVATADDKVMQTYLIESYPTVFVLDKHGRVAGVFIGLGHIDEITKLVERLQKN